MSVGGVGGAGLGTGMPPPAVEGFRLSPQQRRLAQLSGEEAGPFRAQVAVRIEGPLAPAILHASLERVAARHEILRTVFFRPPGFAAPLQRICDPATVAMREADLSHLDEAQRTAEVEEAWQRGLVEPIHLGAKPTVRAELLRLAPATHLLLLRLPALCSDRLGLRGVVRELVRTCAGETDGEPPAQYADVAEAFLGFLESAETEAGREFWRRHEVADAGTARLPGERPAPPETPFAPGVLAFPIPAPVSEALRAAAGRLEVSLPSLFLAAWQCLLGRLCGGPGVKVSASFPGRAFEGLEEAPGLFARWLPIAGAIEPGLRFAAAARWIEAVSAEHAGNQDFFDGADSARFGFELAAKELPRRAGDLAFRVEREHACLEPCLVRLAVLADPSGDEAELLFDTVRISERQVEFLAGRLVRLLADATRDPDSAVDALALVGEAEHRWLTEELNATAFTFPGEARLDVRFREQATRTRDRVAVISEGRQLTFGELDDASKQLARSLAALEVGLETRVAICVERSPEMVVAILAVLKAGGAYVPLDPSYPRERLALMLEDSRAAVLLTQRSLADLLPACGVRVIFLDEPWPEPMDSCGADLGGHSLPAGLAYVIYTSGSTGRPKGVMISHRAILNRLCWMARRFPLAADDRVLQKTPLSFDASIWEIFAPLLEGATLVLARPDGHREPAYLAQLIDEQRITVLQMVPPQLAALLDEAAPESCRGLRRVFCGGDAFPAALRDRFQQRFAAALSNLYGPTESSIDAAFWECRPGEAGAVVPIGRPLDNVRLYLLDAGFAPVPCGQVGELHIAGAGLARGYLGRPEATAERFLPDPFAGQPGERLYATGDLARHREDGAIEFLGRRDHQVKVRGVRLELGEIEAALRRHPGVREAVVLVCGEGADKRLVACVVPAGDAPPASELRGFLRQSLPEVAVPGGFVPLPALPLLPNGKVDRTALAAVSDEPEREEGEALRTPTEEVLAAIWADVLGREGVGRNDSFFDLGGHSLLATKMVSRVRRVFHAEVSLRRLFDRPTVAALAADLDAARGEGAPAPLRRMPRGDFPPLSFAQRRLWFLAQVDPGNPVYNIANALRVRGRLQVAPLAAALREVVRRHEALRTTFPSEQGEPRQRIAPSLDLPLPVGDLSGLPRAAREAEARRLVDAEARRPFDIARGPLLHPLLLRLELEEHVVILTLHHIVGDAWSSALLIRELAALYDAFAQGLPSPLPELPIQYADFAAWQHEWLQGEVLDEQLRYWKRLLSGAPPVLDIPADRPRPAAPTTRGGHLYLQLSEALTEGLKGIGRREGATLFMVVTAAYMALLRYLTGRQDVVVGTDVANRHRLETEGLIGFFINQLVLRTDLAGNPTFRELLARVRDTALGAYAHQDLPFERLLDLLQVERSLQHAPLFQTKLFFQNVPTQEIHLAGLELVPLPSDSCGAKLDLTLACWETPGGLRVWANYSTDLFEAATVGRLLALFDELLTRIAEDADARIDDLNRCLAETEKGIRRMETKERQQLDFQKFKAVKPKPVTLSRVEVVERGELSPGQALPLVLHPVAGDVDLAEWCRAQREPIESDLLRYGAILFRGFGVDAPEAFEPVAAALCRELFNENGEHPRESVSGNVYTPVFYPPDQRLLWHNENSFNRRWPTKILFCCKRPADTGGETPIVDSRKVYERIPAAVREEFERKQVMYCRSYGGGLGLDWREVFRTTRREEIEEACRRDGLTVVWKGDQLQTRTVRPAVLTHPRTGERSWFNQAQHWHVSCLDPETRRSMESLFAAEELPRSCRFGDGTPIPDEAMGVVLDAYRELEVVFPWQRGDVLLVDNVLAAHGRNAFAGERKILVALGDMASFEEI
ncbi:MAG TPA: amino acid adenylation domain-containing protein [Thermoanaerobaculia bacterium]|jgi:amino acid adenylation domain-containing protein|nr:amino acid adenylation domain-containing protein [Thermoanaerobaculia bacterium]